VKFTFHGGFYGDRKNFPFLYSTIIFPSFILSSPCHTETVSHLISSSSASQPWKNINFPSSSHITEQCPAPFTRLFAQKTGSLFFSQQLASRGLSPTSLRYAIQYLSQPEPDAEYKRYVSPSTSTATAHALTCGEFSSPVLPCNSQSSSGVEIITRSEHNS